MKKWYRANRLFIICFLFVIAFWTARVIAINYAGYQYDTFPSGNNYNSDLVSQQNILKDWQAGYRDKVAVGDDNWFIKYPLDVATNNLPVSPTKQLVITNLVVVYITAFFLLYSIYKFIDIFTADKKNRKRALVLMTVFVAIIPTIAFSTLANSDSRNIEVGLTLFMLLQLYRFLYDKNWLKDHFKLKLVLLFITLSSLIADDPLFLYAIVAPIVLVAVGLFIFNKLSSSHTYKLVAFTFLSYIGAFLIKHMISFIFPLTFAKHGPSVGSFSLFENNFILFLQYGLGIFGINVWGDPIGSAKFFIGLVYILVLGLACYFLVKTYKRDNNLFYGGIGFILLWNIIFFIFNSITRDATSSRYLIYALPVEILGLLLAVVSIKTVKQYATMLIALSFGFIFLTYLTFQAINDFHKYPPNTVDHQVIDTLEKNGLTKGYGSYWLASIQTYLSNNKIHEMTVNCDPNASVPVISLSTLLSEDAAYYKLHPDKSFLVYSPAYGGSSCSLQQSEPIFGQPAEVLNFGGPNGDFVAIYNYDIGTKIVP